MPVRAHESCIRRDCHNCYHRETVHDHSQSDADHSNSRPRTGAANTGGYCRLENYLTNSLLTDDSIFLLAYNLFAINKENKAKAFCILGLLSNTKS